MANNVNDVLQQLQHGKYHPFGKWEEERSDIPRGPGLYTIWRNQQFLYAGRTTNLRRRLRQHASGNRHSDIFCTYVFDRFMLPHLSESQANARLQRTFRLNTSVMKWICENLGYRFVEVRVQDLIAIERDLKNGNWPGGKPFLNPA